MNNGVPPLFRKVWFAVISFSVLVLIQKWPNASGEDITHSREFFQQISRSDFLGSMGTVFYGLIPNGFISWYHTLLVLQVLLVGLGLFLIFRNKSFVYSKVLNSLLVLILYLGIMIGSAQTRDGMMLALGIFGIGLYLESKKIENIKLRNAIVFAAWFFVVVGFSFRPWLSISLPFIYLAASNIRDPKQSLQKLSLLGVIPALLVSPLIIDQSTKKLWNLQEAYPQQIVMIHDLAATYCWSVDATTVSHAAKGLSVVATNPKTLNEICQFFKPNTWQAVTGVNPLALPTKGMSAPITLINVNDDSRYESLQEAWLHVITRDPFTYIQNHLSFGTQVLISGESRNLSLMNAVHALVENTGSENFYKFLLSIIIFPYEIITSFHLLSPFVLSIFLIGAYFRSREFRLQVLSTKSVKYSIFAFISWLFLTVITFASDNGRYTYAPIYFVYLVMMLESIDTSRNYSKKKSA
jgi:hypothetical protein